MEDLLRGAECFGRRAAVGSNWNRGPYFRTLNSRILIIRTPK